MMKSHLDMVPKPPSVLPFDAQQEAFSLPSGVESKSKSRRFEVRERARPRPSCCLLVSGNLDESEDVRVPTRNEGAKIERGEAYQPASLALLPNVPVEAWGGGKNEDL